MKKTILIVLVVMLVAVSGAFAAGGSGFAIGGEGSLYFAGSGGLPMSAMLTLHLPQLPLMLGIGISSASDIGLTVDSWLAHGNLVGIFDWYAGIGAYLTFTMKTPSSISAGGRIPLGIQVWPLGQVLELFIEVAPAVGLSIVPTGFEWHFQGAVGFRFWL